MPVLVGVLIRCHGCHVDTVVGFDTYQIMCHLMCFLQFLYLNYAKVWWLAGKCLLFLLIFKPKLRLFKRKKSSTYLFLLFPSFYLIYFLFYSLFSLQDFCSLSQWNLPFHYCHECPSYVIFSDLLPSISCKNVSCKYLAIKRRYNLLIKPTIIITYDTLATTTNVIFHHLHATC